MLLSIDNAKLNLHFDFCFGLHRFWDSVYQYLKSVYGYIDSVHGHIYIYMDILE